MPVIKKKSDKNALVSAPIVTEEEIALKGLHYVKLKKDIKVLESEVKKTRTPLEDYLLKNGKVLPNGSTASVITHAGMDIILKNTLRVGKVLLPEAIEVLKAEGLSGCIQNVEIIREDVLEHLYETGKVSAEVLIKVYQETRGYAFSVDSKIHSHE